MAATTNYLGVTPPISVNTSSDREKDITTELLQELRRQNCFESEEESKTR
jgi:poly(A) polymerase